MSLRSLSLSKGRTMSKDRKVSKRTWDHLVRNSLPTPLLPRMTSGAGSSPLPRPNHKGRGVRSHPFQGQPERAAFMDEKEYESFLEKDAKRVATNVAEDKAESLDRKIRTEQKLQEPDNERIEKWKDEQKGLKEKVEALRKEAGGVVNIQQLLGGWLAWAFFALHKLAREGRIGAHESAGEGYFRAEYALRLAVDDGDFRAAGTLHGPAAGGRPVRPCATRPSRREH